MDRHVRILNAWSRTGDVAGPLLERAGYTVTLTRVHTPQAAREAAEQLPYDLILTELAHCGGAAAILDAVCDVERPPSGVFVNASPLGLRHGVAHHARAGLVIPFRLVDLLSVLEATLALHRIERPQRPLFSVSKLVDDPVTYWPLLGPSVMMDSARALLWSRAQDRQPVRLTGGCATARRAAAKLIHAGGAGRHFCAIGPDERDVLAAWQLAGHGTLYLEDLPHWQPEPLARLIRCVERDGLQGPRLIAGGDIDPAQVGGLLEGLLEPHEPVDLPALADRTADLFALLEARLCRGGRPQWLTGVALADILADDWRGATLKDLEWRLPKAKREEALPLAG